MLHFERWKIWTIIGVCLFGLIAAMPNFYPASAIKNWPKYLSLVPHNKVNLGLDLQGGVYLLMEADTDALKKNWLDNLVAEMRKGLRAAKLPYSGLTRTPDNVRFRIVKPEDAAAALDVANRQRRTVSSVLLGGTGALDMAVATEEGGNVITLTPTPEAITARIDTAMSAIQEVVRKRIDALGTKEPSIQRQGVGRLVVQVPGFSDPQKLIDVIGTTAALSFHAVDESMTPEQARANGVPADDKIFPADPATLARNPDQPKEWLLKAVPEVDGADLVKAGSEFSQQNG